mgnify:CR=1 FL=1
MTHGELIKKLRHERGLTQQQLATGISSRTTLSSLENNQTDITSSILFAYLKRMNISVQEYLFYFNGDSASEKERASQYFYDTVIQQRDLEIKKRILNYQSRYRDSNDFYFCCLSIELKLFLNHKHQQAVFDVDEDMSLIKAYLEHITQWGHFEMSVFSNCLYIFSSDYIRGTFKTLLKRTKILSRIDTYQNDLSIFLNNCIVLSLERHHFDATDFYVQQLFSLSAKTPRQAYDRMMCAYYLELLKAVRGQSSAVSATIDSFRNLGFQEHADGLVALKQRLLSRTVMQA